MNTPTSLRMAEPEDQSVSPWLTLLLAVACGLTAANIYYAQPLAGPISAALGLTAEAAGLIVTLTQIGYGLGLLLIVPLGDLVENRRLTLVLLGVAALALVGAGMSTHPLPFLLSAVCIGVGTVAVQVLVPYAAHLAPEAVRGRVVGNVMSGLMLGIMLARPVSSFITQLTSWHVVFYISAAAMLLLAVVLAWTLPPRSQPGGCGMGRCWRPWSNWPAPRLCCAGARFIMPACSRPSVCSGPPRRCCWRAPNSNCRKVESPCSR